MSESPVVFNLPAILAKANELLRHCQKLAALEEEKAGSAYRDMTLRGSTFFGLACDVADELDPLINPKCRQQGDYQDIERASLSAIEREALRYFRERFDQCLHCSLFRGPKGGVSKRRRLGHRTLSMQMPSVHCLEWAARLRPAIWELQELADGDNRAKKPPVLGFCTDAEIAEYYGLPFDAFRMALVRWRKANPGSGDWKEVSDRKPHEKGFLYRVGAISHIIERYASK